MRQHTPKPAARDNTQMNTQINVRANRRRKSKQTMAPHRAFADRIERFCRLLANIQRVAGELK